MVKVFKNHVLSIFIAIAFSLTQVANVNANYLKNSSQQETTSLSAVKQKVISMATLYAHSLNYGVENKAIIEGKVEKVVEPLTIGFGLLAAGYAISFISSIIGWIKDMVLIFK
ncbi:hypothetical protein [Bartonella refiksaydamii]|uniref:hypothetical protein n=1 Tax=Bartonella refiksaydamii TaxID=2654951 RepID=UPI0012EC45EF|nr:hypothetical protein [Bartonella refiksaydamii]